MSEEGNDNKLLNTQWYYVILPEKSFNSPEEKINLLWFIFLPISVHSLLIESGVFLYG